MTASAAVTRFLDLLADLDDPAVFTSTVDPERLHRLADHVDRRAANTVPLRGTTFAVKDNIDVAGVPTTAGCPGFAYEPTRSAPVVDRLLALGAIPVAKANMDQFATGLVGTRSPYGTPRNPLDASLIPGGSSSGSAVAVARALVDFSLGTDTAGSGRVPAALCGIVGLKPTLGHLSTRGTVPAVRTVDTVSVFARDLWTAGEVSRRAAGFDPRDPFARRAPRPLPRPLTGGVRLGVVSGDLLESLGCAGSVRSAYREVVAVAQGLGIRVRTVPMGAFFELGDLLYGGPWVAERTAAVGEAIARHPEDADPVVAAIVEGGRRYDAVDTHRAGYRRRELLRMVEDEFVTMDALLLPTVPIVPTLADVVADPIGVNTALGRFTTFANLADLCAVSVPVPAPAPAGPGLGVTLLAPAWHDARLVAVAELLRGETVAPVAEEDEGRDIPLVVAGAHLRGEALDHQLVDLGARWMGTTRTAPTYRLWAMRDAEPPKPALVRDAGGAAIEVDLWSVDVEALGRFLLLVPAPLALGRVELADGTTAIGFVAEPRAIDGATEITHLGGWRAYVDRVEGEAGRR